MQSGLLALTIDPATWIVLAALAAVVIGYIVRRAFSRTLTRQVDRVKEELERRLTAELSQAKAEKEQEASELRESVAALRESEQRFRDIFENSTDLIQSITPDGRLLYANQAWQTWLGYDEETIQTVNFLDVIHPDHQARCWQRMQRLLKGEKLDPTDVLLVARDGSEIWAEGHFAVRFENGKAVSMGGIFRDITERKQDERAMRLTQFSVDRSADAIFWITRDGALQYVNDMACRMLGYSKTELQRKMIFDVVPQSSPQNWPRHWQKLKNQRSFMFESTYQTRDGQQFPAEVNVNYIMFAGGEYNCMSVRDITERRRIDMMKKEFISVVSHELRTPLTSIRGSLGLMQGGAAGELSEQAQKMTDIALRNTDRLVRLINDILDIEKIEQGKMDFKRAEIEIGPLIDQVLAANLAFAEKHSVALVKGNELDGAKVHGDSDRLIQVLTNLISNATKYSPENDQVVVSVERRGPHLRFSVSDKGPGIPKEFHSRIFEKFSQADSSTTREKDGTGLGLAISKAIIEEHEGLIGFDTEEGVGTTFYFDLAEHRTS